MKFLQYTGIFLIFLTVGTVIATFFSANQHSSEYSQTLDCSADSVLQFISDTSNATRWIENAESTWPGTLEIDSNQRAVQVVFTDAQNKKVELEQIWTYDSLSKQLIIISTIEDRLEMKNTLTIKEHETTSTIHSKIDLKVFGWLNRLMLSNAEAGLLMRQKAELQAISERCK